MSQNREVKQRKFYRRMFLWMALSSLLPLTIFAVIAYYNAERTVLGNEYQSNKKILQQIKFNIDYMNDMILNSVFSLYYNADVRTIMYSNDSDLADTLDAMNKIKASVLNTNPFIHSIYIYNNKKKTFFTTMDDLFFQDKQLSNLMAHSDLPTLKPLPRKIEFGLPGGNTREENVVTYFMYDFKDADNLMNGGLVVNASTEWLLTNMKNINMVDEKKQDKIMILDDHGEVVGNNPADAAFNSALQSVYRSYTSRMEARGTPASSGDPGVFTDTIEGRKYLITYSPVDKMNWTLVKAQLYREVFRQTNTLKLTFLLIAALFVVLGFLVSFTISRRIYKPIGRLVQQVVSAGGALDPWSSKDEISYLNEAYKLSANQLAQYRERRNSDLEIGKTYFLRKLLIDSASVTAEEFAKIAAENGLAVTPEDRFAVCVVKLDDLAGFEQQYSPNDKSLLKFGLINISSEIIRSVYPVEAVEMKNDYIAFLLKLDDSIQVDYGELAELWKRAQFYIDKYYHISISVAISGRADHYGMLSDCHYAALDDSMYRFIFGKASVLHRAMLENNRRNAQMGYSAALEKRLLDSLKSGAMEPFEETFERIFKEMSGLSYHNVLLSVMQLINTLSHTFGEINRSKVEPVHVNFNLVAERLFKLETLSELQAEIWQICTEAMTRTGKLENEKQSILIEAIREMIHADYKNPNLSLSYIADRLNLSAKHISKVFAGQSNMSVADYITEVRLAKAVEWLQSSNLSIKDIVARIGIENESYFYKLFKKRYGITPKEYALNRAVKEARTGGGE